MGCECAARCNHNSKDANTKRKLGRGSLGLDRILFKRNMLQQTIHEVHRNNRRQVNMDNINPFTATACKISGLKSAHIHASKQYIRWSCNKSTLNILHFDRNSFMCSCEGGMKALIVSNWHFYSSFSEWRRDEHGSERVKRKTKNELSLNRNLPMSVDI